MLQPSNQTSLKQLVSTVSSQGQVTIPALVRRHLGVDTDDKVAFVIEETGEVKLTQATYPDIASLRGVAGSLRKPLSWERMKQIAREDRLQAKYGK